MPYTLANLPDNIQKLSAKKQRQWMQVWNSAYNRAKGTGKADKDAETAAFAQANGVVLGSKASNSAEFVASIATFELSKAATPLFEDGDLVYRTGKLFVAGDYQDKQYAMTADEIAAAAEAFSEPLAIDLEHVPTPLDGKLGELVSVEARGNELHGIVALPKWLDGALDERKVSATWDRATKMLAGLALVRNPRVSDAALMAAFAVDEILHDDGDAAIETLQAWFASSRHDTPEGQQIMQELHNTSARGGAVCKAGNTAKMASSHESSTIQKVHDMTTEHGAACSSKKPGQGNWPYMFSRKDGSAMTSAWDWLKAKLEGEPAPEGSTASTTSTATLSADDPEIKRLREEAERNATEVRRLRLERIQDQAVAFADSQIRERRAFPAEKEAIVADYVQRATDDVALGVVTFGEGDKATKTTRVDMLKADFAARPPHTLNVEHLKPEELAALSNRQTTDSGDSSKPSPKEKLDEMIGLTPMGKAHLSARNGAKN